jgi:hypothetical protein
VKRLTLLCAVGLLALIVAAPAEANKSVHKPMAHVAKKKCKKHKKKCKKKRKSAPIPAPAPPAAPLALTESEVETAVNQAAYNYCLPDIYCFDYGIYVDYTGGPISCSSRTTYEWACYGWNYETDLYSFEGYCDFREIVTRSGYNGVTSHQDTSYGSSGWDCYSIFGKEEAFSKT